MIDIEKASKLLEDYFANVTTEQFSSDLRKFCPELFEEEQNNGSESLSVSEGIDRAERVSIVNVEASNRAEIYRQAKADNRRELASKLLHKGLSIEEVAEILELDSEEIANNTLDSPKVTLRDRVSNADR